MNNNKVAKVYYSRKQNGSEYDHPSIWVYDNYDYSVPENHNSPVHRLEFQRNPIRDENDKIAKKFNPSGYWSESYACSFDARYARVDLLEKQLSFIKKLNRVIETYNLKFVANGDELHLIALALEKLKYDVQSNPSILDRI